YSSTKLVSRNLAYRFGCPAEDEARVTGLLQTDFSRSPPDRCDRRFTLGGFGFDRPSGLARNTAGSPSRARCRMLSTGRNEGEESSILAPSLRSPWAASLHRNPAGSVESEAGRTISRAQCERQRLPRLRGGVARKIRGPSVISPRIAAWRESAERFHSAPDPGEAGSAR